MSLSRASAKVSTTCREKRNVKPEFKSLFLFYSTPEKLDDRMAPKQARTECNDEDEGDEDGDDDLQNTVCETRVCSAAFSSALVL